MVMKPTSLDDTSVSYKLLDDLVDQLTPSWRKLGEDLGVGRRSLNALTNIDTQNQRVEEKYLALFHKWKRNRGDSATVKVLSEALENIGRSDLSKKVKATVTEPSSLEDTPVSHELLDDLAENFNPSWKIVGRHLGIPEDALTNIDMENRREEQKYVALFDKWKKTRGAEATARVLKDALEKAGRNDLAKKIKVETKTKISHGAVAARVTKPAAHEQTYVKHSEIPEGADYTAASGYVMMINNYRFPKKRRHYKETIALQMFEFRELQDLFVSKFGFGSREYENLTKSEMLNELTQTAEKDFSEYDCFVCVILSDGSKDGIFGIDDEMISLEIITSLFTRDKCPSLDGKPKIFLIETFERRQTDEGPPPRPVISEEDFLIWYAPLDCFSVFSTPLRFVAKSLKYHSSKHLVDILMRANEGAESELPSQRPYLVSTLTKKVFFKSK